MKRVVKHSCSTLSQVIHYMFLATFIILLVVLPIVYTQTGTPPYWVIYMIFGILLSLYSVYMVPFVYILQMCVCLFLKVYIIMQVIQLIYKKSLLSTISDPEQQSIQVSDEIVGLQTSNSSLHTSSLNESDTTTIGYNPSTVGIPPSSFLAPTIHQQGSIRSSSLDYTPPPPAYQDMIYPPSYRSTNSTKDDSQSVVHSINNNRTL